MANDSPYAELLKKKPLFIGNIDLVEIHHDRLEITGWAWDRRFPTGKSEALILLGSQILGIAIGSGQREDLRAVSLGSAGIFKVSCPRTDNDSEELKHIRLISFDGINDWNQSKCSIRLMGSIPEREPEIIDLEGRIDIPPPAAFSLKTDPQNPYYVEIMLFSCHELDGARLRMSIDEGEAVCWVKLGDPWVHPERGVFPTIRLSQLPLPHFVLDGEEHRIRLDLIAGSLLIEGLKLSKAFPVSEPLSQRFQRQLNLIRGYNTELNHAEHALAQAEKNFREAETTFADEKADLEIKLAELEKSHNSDHKQIDFLKAKLEERQKKVEELLRWRERESRAQERLLKILEES